MKKILFICILLFQLFNTKAQEPLRLKNFNLDKNKLALQGYDPVAYFTQQKAIKGDKNFAAKLEGIIYYFSSESNKMLFLKDPKKFEPAYGGWCAYAMGKTGEKVEIDPETFEIRNGNLYLFYHTWTNNTKGKWDEDVNNLNPKADQNWTKIFH
ncbi:MAG: YHS domain protein [Sediminibacterium sp.]|nr:YHS domain protein [Sediminibacterium sp.]